MKNKEWRKKEKEIVLFFFDEKKEIFKEEIG